MNVQVGWFFKVTPREESLWEKVMVPICHVRCRVAKAIGVWSPRVSFIASGELLWPLVLNRGLLASGFPTGTAFVGISNRRLMKFDEEDK